MADNYLITGYWGTPHVTSENDRGINAATFGVGRSVLPVGEEFKAEYIGNNTIRMYDGKLVDNGAVAGIPAGEYVDLTISNAGQGKKRNDLIVFQYSKDASTLIETGVFTVLRGAETSGTAADPVPTQNDILAGNATIDQYALWRVSVNGTTISAPVKLFNVSTPLSGKSNTTHTHTLTAGSILGVLPVSKGGTNATDGLSALKSLGGLPVLSAEGAGNDLNLIGKTGEFAWYTVDGSTINTPKYVGMTGASLGYVLNIPSGSTGATQYAAQLAIYKGGTYAIFYRHANGGASLEGWGKIIPNPKPSYKTLWSGSATDGTRITFNENIWNYQYIVGSLEYTETNVMLLSKNLSEVKCLMQAGLLGGNGGVVTRICNLEIAADGLSATVTKCARMTHSANGNHTAETAITLTHVIGLTVA